MGIGSHLTLAPDPRAAHLRVPLHSRVIFSALAQDEAQLPANEATAGIVDAMAAAHRARGDPDAVVAMIVQPGERNAYDQQARWHTPLAWAVTPAAQSRKQGQQTVAQRVAWPPAAGCERVCTGVPVSAGMSSCLRGSLRSGYNDTESVMT